MSLNRESDRRKRESITLPKIEVTVDCILEVIEAFKDDLAKRCKQQHGLKNAKVTTHFNQANKTINIIFSGKDIDNLHQMGKHQRYRDMVYKIGFLSEFELKKWLPAANIVFEGFERDKERNLVYRVELRIVPKETPSLEEETKSRWKVR